MLVALSCSMPVCIAGRCAHGAGRIRRVQLAFGAGPVGKPATPTAVEAIVAPCIQLVPIAMINAVVVGVILAWMKAALFEGCIGPGVVLAAVHAVVVWIRLGR